MSKGYHMVVTLHMQCAKWKWKDTKWDHADSLPKQVYLHRVCMGSQGIQWSYGSWIIGMSNCDVLLSNAWAEKKNESSHCFCD